MKKNMVKMVSLIIVMVIVFGTITVLAADKDRNGGGTGDSELFAIRTNIAIDRESKETSVSLEYIRQEDKSNSLGFPVQSLVSEVSPEKSGDRDTFGIPTGCGATCGTCNEFTCNNEWTCESTCYHTCDGHTCDGCETCSGRTCGNGIRCKISKFLIVLASANGGEYTNECWTGHACGCW